MIDREIPNKLDKSNESKTMKSRLIKSIDHVKALLLRDPSVYLFK